MDYVNWGTDVRDLILGIANQIVVDDAPGWISLGFLIAGLVCGLSIWFISKTRVRVLRRAQQAVRNASGGNGQDLDLASVEASLNSFKSAPAKRLANAFGEFRETLLEIGRGDDIAVRNSIRPSAFLNTDDLGFSLKGWRHVPGLFVSFGLLFTFLGLVAVLSSTADLLPQGSGIDQSQTTTALRGLLGKASAKFIISLTGLFCSIVLNIYLRLRSSSIENDANKLAIEIEKSMNFISLEGLAERQLKAIENQTINMQELNTRLIAELSEPLKKVSESSIENLGTMVNELGSNITAGIGGSMELLSERIETAANSLNTIGLTLNEAAKRFETALESSTSSWEKTIRRLENVTEQLTSAGKNIGEATPAILETIKESNASNLRIAEGAADMVNSAKTTIHEEKTVVLEAMQAIQDLIRSFESRAAAYDGQLEQAFKTYQNEVAATIDRLESHGEGVQERFADALSTLQAVIENAKAFEPESLQLEEVEGAKA